MKSVQQEFIWSDVPLPAAKEVTRQDPNTELLFPATPDSNLEELRSPADDSPQSAELGKPPLDDAPGDPPIAKPLRQAVEACVFGITDQGPVDPDEEEVAAITTEHVHEMLVRLLELQEIIEATHSGRDPRTGRVPKTPEKQRKLAEDLQHEERQLTEGYADAVAVYANAFGDEAADALDEWVRKVAAGPLPQRNSYSKGHPWHYYTDGDNAAPIPVKDIPAATNVGQWLERELPKNRSKQLVRVGEMLEAESKRLEEAELRYQEVVERGAEALSRYDREIAYGGNDALARAGTLALLFNHICNGRGRIAWLEAERTRLAGGGTVSR